MPKLNLPEYAKCDKVGKNEIIRVLEPKVEVEIISAEPDFVTLQSSEGKTFSIQASSAVLDKSKGPVLVTEGSPDPDRILSGDQEVSWSWHPSEDLNTDQIRKSWINQLSLREEIKEAGMEQSGFRTPQLGAIHAALAHWAVSDGIATVVMPTGTGKTETMLALLVSERCERLLVTVPSDSLRGQLFGKFSSLGLLKQFGLVYPKAERPIVGVLYEKFETKEELVQFIQKCNVVVTTMAGVAGYSESLQECFAENFPYYFVDEAHHMKAKTWSEFIDKFTGSKVLQFTATPFRNDGAKLNGQIIFNYPLKRAQKDGYFTKINYSPVFEIDPENADIVIANKAVQILKEQEAKGFTKQIVMARCENKKRAKDVYEIYKALYPELNPVLIYSGSGMSDKVRRIAIDALRAGFSRIVVCVDMLGEGFDLPTLKIAALHDVKKSLTVTLQLIGRFTRTKFDEDLGEASFVVNTADISVGKELETLYSQDADWNELLPELSANAIEEEIKLGEFLKGFSIPEELNIPLQNLRPALSTVVYRNPQNVCQFDKYLLGITLSDGDKAWSFVNDSEQVQIIIIARQQPVDWGNIQNIGNIVWDLLVVINDRENHLLYINGSDNNGIYAPLAEALLGDKPSIIRQSEPFRAFHNIKRVRLQNVGLKQFIGRNVRFRMSVGSDVGEALTIAEKASGQKAFVVGSGYEDGNKVTLGCSYKGRIWTLQTASISKLAEWCKHIGKKVSDPAINGDDIIKESLVPTLVTELPKKQCVWVDWNEELYELSETKIEFHIGGNIYYLQDTSISLSSEKCSNEKVVFALECLSKSSGIIKKCEISMKVAKDEHGEPISIFQQEESSVPITVIIGRKTMGVAEFFHHFEPSVFYADGSCLTGNEYVELKTVPGVFPLDRIETWDWTGVHLDEESQGVGIINTSSIQYHVIEKIRNDGYRVIYDDDNAGEMADIVAIKESEDVITVDLFHLKYAKEGKVSSRIDNLYEVCGQAQKSVHWKFKDSKEFFRHLYRRMIKKADGQTGSRFVVGNEQDLQRLETLAKVKLPMKFSITIVQPGLSHTKITEDQKMLLAVTEQYLLDVANIPLRVIGNIL